MRRHLRSLALAALLTAVAAAVPAAAHASDDGTVRGVVLADGKPVAGVSVGYMLPNGYCQRGGGGFGSTVTAADGSFAFGEPADVLADGARISVGCGPNGTFTTPSGARYVDMVLGAASSAAAAAVYGAQVPVATAAQLNALSPLRLQLRRAGSIIGTARVAEHAQVDLLDARGGYLAGKRVGASGSFSFRSLVPGRYQVRAQRSTDDQWTTTGMLAVAAGAEVRATLPGYSTVTGRITVAGRTPRKRLEVGIDRVGTTTIWSANARTKTDGTFSVRGLTVGDYDLSVNGADPTGNPIEGVQRTVRIHVTAPGGRVVRNVNLARGATVQGTIAGFRWTGHGFGSGLMTVTDAQHRIVRFSPLMPRVSSSRLVVHGLPAGRLTIAIASSDRLAIGRVDVAANGTALLGTMRFTKPALHLSGSVPGGKRSTIALVPVGGDQSIGAGVDASGHYRLTELPPGRYSVIVSRAGRFDGTSTILLTRSTTRTLRLGPVLGTVHGTLRLNGARLSKGTVWLEGPDGREVVGTASSSGAVTVHAPAGTYRLSALTAEPGNWDDAAVPPFWLAPTTDRTFTVQNGHATVLGDVALRVTG